MFIKDLGKEYNVDMRESRGSSLVDCVIIHARVDGSLCMDGDMCA